MPMGDYLVHYGILGQKWGIRRYQNEDGTLTEEGRRHYSSRFPEPKRRLDLRGDPEKRQIRNKTFNTLRELDERFDTGPKGGKLVRSVNKIADKVYPKEEPRGSELFSLVDNAFQTCKDYEKAINSVEDKSLRTELLKRLAGKISEEQGLRYDLSFAVVDAMYNAKDLGERYDDFLRKK